MSIKSLLIKTQTNKKFLTYEKNLPSLIEFAKTFHAEIYLVEHEDDQIVLELKGLIGAICDSEHQDKYKYKKINKIFPQSKRNRKNILKDSEKIRQYVSKRLLTGKSVSLKELKEKYKEKKLTDACLCNHLAMVRKTLSRDGHEFKKIGAGTYCLNK